MPTYDHYGAARSLIAMMRAEGFADAARELDDAIRAGFTSGEIFMALRWHIDAFLAAKPDCSQDLLRSAQDLRARLDRALA